MSYFTAVKLKDENGVAYGVKQIENVPATVDILLYEVHKGSVFVASDVVDLANAAVRDILLVTSSMDVHLFIDIQTEAEADYKLYEGATASDNGTAINTYNKDRNSTNAPIVTCFHTPTVAGGSEGTLLMHKHWGSGKAAGGEDQSLIVWMIKPDTKYLLRITNATTSDNQVSSVLHMYEH